MIVLGIESSCDETSVAIVEDGQEVLSQVTFSQVDTHKVYGGVVPEIAAREHLVHVDSVIWQALDEAQLNWINIDRIAVVNGPGLVSSLLVGVSAAKTLAWTLNKEIVAVNHLKAHICANFLEWKPVFPFVCLLASGGHTQIILVKSFKDFELLGSTIDDSAGEAFDKVARLLDLDYPGGPSIEKLAKEFSVQQTQQITLPTGKVGKFNFSFSGLKTAVLRLVQQFKAKDSFNRELKAELAYVFQKTVCADLAQKLVKAAVNHNCSFISIAGGVAANQILRQTIQEQLKKTQHKAELIAPKIQYCTDNGAMVASAGYFCPESFGLDFKVYSRVAVEPKIATDFS